ncbi:glycosyltransferase family 2 protein [Nocardiopsis dassonvillei]|uniref:glycosyltransferase family 2 protein n=1 Tax=Nocardiopsis dassonvillei TaxID=2014 RepID=UPI0033FD3D69
MMISVIIPSYNSRASLEACLISLNHQELESGYSFEVVVVDDGSTDGTEGMVERLELQYEFRYIYKPRTENSSRAAARNNGILESSGDLIVFIDADEVVSPYCLAEHLRYHEIRSDMVVLGPRRYLADGAVNIELLAKSFSLDALPETAGLDPRLTLMNTVSYNLNNLATCWHYLHTCNASVRRSHLFEVGLFDERFKGWGLEDSELGYRLRKHGLAFAFNKEAIVYHESIKARSDDLYPDWCRNIETFFDLHKNPEVATQGILHRSFNPKEKDLSWIECALRFEYATRALQGRFSGKSIYQIIEVNEHNIEEECASLHEKSEKNDLLVIDYVGDANLAAIVQCLRTKNEVLYFPRPSAKKRNQILADHRISVNLKSAMGK